MGTGAITAYIDVAQIALYAFWAFFAGLIYYLHREDKREGYPLESDRSGQVNVQGWPPIPKPKTFKLRDGSTVMAPNFRVSKQPLGGAPLQRHLGAPLEPAGNPMLAGVGPGSWSDRADIADTTVDGAPRIVPLRAAPGFAVWGKDTDPRGLPVFGADGRVGGTVTDVWVDRAEMVFRYLEVAVSAEGGARTALLPINFARIGSQRVKVRSILASQFAQVPATRDADMVTLLEEEKIMGYYGGGTLYATPDRQEPLL
ncbi:MAG: photosynthetic reaction center subunit H [Caldimonas sp.]